LRGGDVAGGALKYLIIQEVFLKQKKRNVRGGGDWSWGVQCMGGSRCLEKKFKPQDILLAMRVNNWGEGGDCWEKNSGKCSGRGRNVQKSVIFIPFERSGREGEGD